MRIALMVLGLLPMVPYYIYRFWKYGKSEDFSIEESFFYIKKVVTKANRAGRVTVDAKGMENLPKENGFMIFPNHQGLYDVLSLLETSPKAFSFVLKKEASTVILLKQIVSALKAYPMDRDDIRQSMKVIQQISEDVKKGKNVLIFAEGTRSRNGNNLLDFKGGSFKSATKAKCPIVPVALIDCFIPFDEKSIRPVTVKVRYLEPLYYEDYKDMNTKQIASLVKERIEEAIKKEMV